jgi:hypothetical protein
MRTIASLVLLSSFLTGISAQPAPTTTPLTTVPRLVRISNTFHPANGLATAPVEGVTLSIYREEQGGAPLWQETQNVTVDAEGRYTALMGSTLNDGMPLELFTAGEPRWLGVQFQRTGEVEQPRVLLTSVPYALKAADADTLGGLPASSYMLLPTATAGGTPSATAPVTTSAVAGVKSPKPLLTSGSANYIGVFTNATDLGNSVMYQANGNIGVGTTAPLISLDARTGSLPQMGIAGTTDYLTFFASDVFGPAIYWDPAKDMRFGKGGAGLYNPYGFVEQMRIQSSTGNVGIGTMTPGSKLDVAGDINLAGNLRKGGALFLHNLGTQNTAVGLGALNPATTGSYNTASGFQALFSNTTGYYNTASGFQALNSNTTGYNNTASGAFALSYNTTGGNNTASGADALYSNTSGGGNTASGFVALLENTTGSNNTASGSQALYNNTIGSQNTASGYQALLLNTTGGYNTASGYQALQNNTTGGYNTASGYQALQNNTTGYDNIALGYYAGGQLTTGSNNIMIGNYGSSSDDSTIRIGGGQTKTFIAGIAGVSVTGGAAVYVNSNGQLGTSLSSRRFKEQITDMGDSSSKLFQLRPVNFFYKPQYDDGSQLLQYGLIAEEVAKVYPEMVAYNSDGEIMTVKYQLLAPMLLNEMQKQSRELQEQRETIRQQQEQNRQQNEQVCKLEARLAALEALLSGKAPTTATGGQ